jgi:predicted nucleotidyltransferase
MAHNKQESPNSLNLLLGEEELSRRRELAVKIANSLTSRLSWVSVVYLFGSTVRGEAKMESDIDLVVETPVNFLRRSDYDSLNEEVRVVIGKAARELGAEDLAFNTTLVSRDWVTTPVGPTAFEPEFINNLRREGEVLALNPLYPWIKNWP